MQNNNPMNRLRGKRYIRFVRCSTKGQADTSIDDQLALLDKFARERGMVHVDDLILEGVSGSLPRQHFERLIDRKREREDFDVLLVQDISRLTRSGSKHGAKVESLEAAGIDVVFALETVPEGAFGDIYKSMQYYAARETAKGISTSSTRGAQSALEQGRAAACRRPPFGIDRLYTAEDGTPKYVLRNLPDGGQLKLDPTTGAVVERFGRNVGKGYNHNRKQKGERIVLVPGDAQAVTTVRLIYRRFFIDNWGQHRIAKELNDGGAVGPTGGPWQMNAVMRILRNVIFTGRSIANFWTSGIYNMRNPGAPKSAEQAPGRLAGRVKPPQVIRPREEWRVQDEPRLRDYLGDEHLRGLAVAYQDQQLDARAGGYEPKVNRDRHRESAYILKGILTSKQGNLPMSGSLRGRKAAYRRHYSISKAFHYPRSGDRVMRKAVLAAPLEELVLNAVRMTLLNAPNLKTMLKRQIERELKAQKTGADHAARLRAELNEIRLQMEFIVKQCAVIGEDEAATQLAQYAKRRDDLQRQSRLAEASAPLTSGNVDGVVEAVVTGLRKTGEHLRHYCRAALRRLLELMVAKAEVDLETGHLDLELRLPLWALTNPERMCLDHPFARRSSDEAHQRGLVLMKFRLLRMAKQYLGYGVAA